MYFKKLELTGFKSFANYTNMDFAPGITAIVGPNGSGKSNIVDGIRWVLGEQSAKTLRGQRMDEVIFAGSANRKAVGYAEITITFDNENKLLPIDAPEVSITRRAYRSGEGEYFLNQSQCRLRDIQELLMDTGVGKNSYSILGQGKIDAILSSKSEDRRAIFEEVAGIVKYRTRKEDAEKRLESTENNIVRLQDLLSELEQQNLKLSEQAAKAKTYIEIKQELKDKEIQVFVHKIEHLDIDLQKIEEELVTIEETQSKLKTEIKETEVGTAKIKNEYVSLNESQETLQNDLLKVTQELAKIIGDEKVGEERSKNNAQAKQNLTNQIKELSKELDNVAKTKHKLKVLLTGQEEQLEKYKQQALTIQEKLSELKIEQLDTNHKQELTSKINIDENQLVELRDEKTRKETLLNELQKRLSEMDENNSRLLQQNQELEKEHNKVLKAHQEAVQALERIEKTGQEISEQLSDTTIALNRLIAQQGEHKNNLIRLKDRQRILSDLESNKEGFFKGVKSILEREDKGIYGAVSQLLKVPQKYEIAIETALGSNMQHLVVADENVARRNIEYLKEKNLGRATFLPLNILKLKILKSEDEAICKSMKGFVGIAATLVESDSKYDVLIAYLLGMILITTNIKEANEIARAMHYRYRLVTLDGDTINIGGSMSGGSRHKNVQSFLSRSREINELSDNISQLENSIQEIEPQIKEKTNLQIELTAKLKEIQEKIQDQHNQLSELAFAIHDLELRQKRNQDEVNQQKISENNSCNAQIEELNLLEQQISELENTVTENKQKILNLQEDDQDRHKIVSEINKELTDIKVEIAKTEQDIKNSNLKIKELEEKNRSLIEKEASIQKNLEQIKLEIESGSLEVNDLAEQKKHLNEQRSELHKQMANLKQQLHDKHEQQLEYEALNKKHNKELNQAISKHQRLEIEKNKIEIELDAYLKQLGSNYEMSFEQACKTSLRNKNLNIDEAMNKVETLRNKLSELDGVSVASIDEHEKLNERIQFLNNQEQDLTETREKLFSVIDWVEQEITRIFKESFANIREHFQTSFTEMFEGGNGDISLTNPKDILNTGVEITAQPPGKKSKSLSLLSGGERALTAIALLFAILRSKPSPFCVLDEVDAALDEANISRFMRYVHHYSNQTQFIIVTHRKQTMEKTDVLYGVTMQEATGVSEIVSLKLQEVEVSVC